MRRVKTNLFDRDRLSSDDVKAERLRQLASRRIIVLLAMLETNITWTQYYSETSCYLRI